MVFENRADNEAQASPTGTNGIRKTVLNEHSCTATDTGPPEYALAPGRAEESKRKADVNTAHYKKVGKEQTQVRRHDKMESEDGE